ncbi:MAG: PAS-domain containing protein [Ascidiaceihabitans sp.]|nr:PAS-domain containing protein [Ascidiaceihabitans sp.]
MTFQDIILVIFVSGVTAVAGLLFVAWMPVRSAQSAPQPITADISLLFRGPDLEHASNTARFILAQNSGETDWISLYRSFGARFPALPRDPVTDRDGSMILAAQDIQDTAVLKIDRVNECTHVQVVDPDALGLDDHHRVKSLEAELQTLRLASSTAPHPTWQADENGNVKWCNDAYKALYQDVHGSEPDPKNPLLKSFTEKLDDKGQSRASLKVDDERPSLWFDVSSMRVDDGTMFHAIDINAVIRAEIAQRNFVQTLAKTFAQLSTGLAIFDRNGQLALFNPALVDLTSLPADFLSARPDLSSFFDRLRDNRVMPEPKNYRSWRQEISDVISAATDGRYQETWSLESGQTYRVSGRPHLDGAIAFLIEDTSAEMLLTRNFRAELELSQSLMDTFDDALVVFSSAGLLQFCNTSYREMWKLDPENSFAEVTIIDTIKDWQKQCHPNPAWGEVRNFIMNFEERAPWDATIEHNQHSELRCHVDPIVSGATLIRFSRVRQTQTSAKKLTNMAG